MFRFCSPLSSLSFAHLGLDDYPRATVPSEIERHVDFLSWLAFFSRFLSELAATRNDETAAAHYKAEHTAQLQSLQSNHWNPKAGAFCDWGEKLYLYFFNY